MKNQKIIIITTALAVLVFLIPTSGCKKKTPQDTKVTTDSYDTTFTEDYAADSASIAADFKLTNYDTPPQAVKNPMPAYPEQYKSSGIQGVVVLEVEVTAEGTVRNVKVMKSLLSGQNALDETAVNAVKNWVFKPALKNNKPVDAKVTVAVPFTLIDDK